MSIEYLNKYIVGQNRIKPEIDSYLEAMKSGEPINLMIRGQSGYGKTHLAKVIAKTVNHAGNRAYYLGEECLNFLEDCHTHILDEVHEIRNPEFLYPYLDMGRYNFLILTNEFGNLKEPLMNRCIVVDLEPYTDEELAILISRVLRDHHVEPDMLQTYEMATYARGNPRVAKVLAKRLSLFFKLNGVPKDVDELRQILEEQFHISEGGFTNFDKQYLTFLETNGKAGLATISRVLMIPKGTLEREVEPFLLRKGLIRITSRGRELVNPINHANPVATAKYATTKLGELKNDNRV